MAESVACCNRRAQPRRLILTLSAIEFYVNGLDVRLSSISSTWIVGTSCSLLVSIASIIEVVDEVSVKGLTDGREIAAVEASVDRPRPLVVVQEVCLVSVGSLFREYWKFSLLEPSSLYKLD